LFFPSDDPTSSLIVAFGAFAAGFLMRPLGSILLGYVGDRFGRRKLLVLSVLAMAFSTFAIGLLPTHADIGATARMALFTYPLFVLMNNRDLAVMAAAQYGLGALAGCHAFVLPSISSRFSSFIVRVVISTP
jgi:MFS family permease